MDADAYEQTVLMYKDRVYAYAARMLRNPAEAQDVAQEALVRLWQHRGRVERGGARTWLVRTAHNLCIDAIRRRNVRSEVEEGQAVMDTQAHAGPDPGRLTQAVELKHKIEHALDRLTPEDRAVVILREVQGLPYEEIADILRIPLGTLKARLHRARERLRMRLTRVGVTP